MLVVLDEIHRQVCDLGTVDFEKVLLRLKDSETMTFHFVNYERKRPAYRHVCKDERQWEEFNCI